DADIAGLAAIAPAIAELAAVERRDDVLDAHPLQEDFGIDDAERRALFRRVGRSEAYGCRSCCGKNDEKPAHPTHVRTPSPAGSRARLLSHSLRSREFTFG